ncbi:MAG TPA: 6-phosphogluconolactonase [Gaiellaceae bacterium]
MAIRSLNGVAIHITGDWERLAAGWLARAVAAGGHVALSGGSMRAVYALAADLEGNWANAHVWLCDERVVPLDDERSNFRLVQESVLTRVRAAPLVHAVEPAPGAEAAAARYDEELRGVTLDLAVMGIGPDGHTASLFPGAPGLDEHERRAIAAAPGLEPWVERVTMTPPVFAAAELLLYVAAGEAKAEAVKSAFADDPSRATPASLIRGRETMAILDPAAAALL